MRFTFRFGRVTFRGLKRSIVALGMLASSSCLLWAQETEVPVPASPDDSWTVELLVREPDLVTPTAITVDATGRVFVIECHTHFRPADYAGPPADRIRLMIDSDGNGSLDQISTFFEGTVATMGLLLEEDGGLLVATRNELFRLRDTNADNVADERTILAHLETKGDYPHNGLSGLAIDQTGCILVGFGENLGEDYAFIAADGSAVRGGGEGGNVFRLRPDGSQAERWATGFWNPFQLTVDDFGRVFVVDNDPDWRPPCRLIHVVEGGDYGYRFALGRRGTHPFTTWFGDRPDRLGMVAGTGEAPSGMISYRGGNLDAADEGSLIVTSWGLHTLERYRLIRQGGSFSSMAEIRMKGGEDYRPVGIAIDPNGALIVSDWVKRSYPLHGHGRIWRHRFSGEHETIPASDDPWQNLRGNPSRQVVRSAVAALIASADQHEALRAATIDPQVDSWRRAWIITGLYHAKQLDRELLLQIVEKGESEDLCVLIAPFAAELGITIDELLEKYAASKLAGDGMEDEVLAEWTRRCARESDTDRLRAQLAHDDPFVKQATIFALSRVVGTSQQCEPFDSEPESIRLALASVLARRDDAAARQIVPSLMTDSAESVRWVTLRWITESGLAEYRDLVQQELKRESLSPGHFEAVLATLEQLNGRSGAAFEGAQITLLESIIKGENNEPGTVIAMALRHLDRAARRDRVEQVPAGLQLEALKFLLNHRSTEVRAEAVRVMSAWHSTPDAQDILFVVATDERQPELVRREALAGLQDPNSLMLLATGDSSLQDEAIRSLRGRPLSDDQKAALAELTLAPTTLAARDRLLSQVDDGRPSDRSAEAWLDWLSEGEPGDSQRGERWFFHSSLARCSSCHAVQGRGASIGPDLSVTGQMGRVRLLESIVDPSREMAPRYTPWLIETVDGSVRSGLLETERGELQFYVDSTGSVFQVDFDDVVTRIAAPHSIMPDDLLSTLTRDEIADLLAYLETLK